jgi:hypothetical protein
MTKNSFRNKFAAWPIAVLLVASLSACASTYSGPPGIGLPDTATKLIAEKYSYAPDVKRAAEGFAVSTVEHWRAAVATGKYDEELSLKSVHGQMCWTARLERTLKRDVTSAELLEFVAAISSTKELFSASRESDHLQSGHPLAFSSAEATACRKAGIE